MKSYRVAREWRKLSDLDNLNYSITIFDDGDVCSICTDAGAHGTHVAGIVAAYDPAEPAQNGVAPGAQIVSLKIGDTRLSSMETGPGLTRALIECARLKVDFINMSYGEAGSECNQGRFVDLANKIVDEHGITFVASAGNNGPAITTVGAPGGTTSALISVAAYVSPMMMEDQYALLGPQGSPLEVPQTQRGDGLTYTWSSVGPCLDGALGVSIAAPGAAISPVPTWTLQSKQLMNGTSMSSPNACGCLALLKAAATAKGLGEWLSPNLLRRAVESTARAIEGGERVGMGSGLIQVPEALGWLERHAATSPDCRFKVSVDGSKRGVFLRSVAETRGLTSHAVEVVPLFKASTPNSVRTALDLKLTLESDAPWLTCPARLALCHSGRGFTVFVDPRQLKEGALHSATIRAKLDTEAGQEAGAFFEVPVTVAKPVVLVAGCPDVAWRVEKATPGKVERRFVAPPPGASWVEVTLKDERPLGEPQGDADSSAHLLMAHLVQLLPSTPYRDHETKQALRLRPGAEKTVTLALEAMAPLEITVAQFWSSPGSAPVSVGVKFRGVTVEPNALALSAYTRTPLRFTAALRDEVVEPRASLTKCRRPLHPSSAKISPLKSRDFLPGDSKGQGARQSFELVLDYSLVLEAGGDAKDITPVAPMLNGLLYEASVDGQMCLVLDSSTGKVLGVGDAWPDPIKLKPGAYTIRYQVRHDELSVLKELEKMVVYAEFKLKDSLSVPCFATAAQASIRSGASSAKALKVGESHAVVFVAPKDFPKDSKSGDVLLGAMHCVKKAKDVERPGGWPVTLLVPPQAPPEKPSTESGKSAESASESESEALKLAKALLGLKVKSLESLAGKSAEFKALHDALVDEGHGAHLPLLLAVLKHAVALGTAVATAGEAGVGERRPSVVAAADAVIASVDPGALSASLGLRALEGEAKAERELLDERRGALVEALTRKADVLLEEASLIEASDSEQTGEAVKQLEQWEDLFDVGKAEALAAVACKQLRKAGKPGKLAKYATGALAKLSGSANKATREVLLEAKSWAFERLGWAWLVQHEAEWKALNNPKTNALF
mmetsp:Transcript_30341/g.68019  ORF Transcript_30341/g.68019 Transcript_30341/m.68019 type:complete len:1069 (+) Transcript_30341:301-3507(+)